VISRESLARFGGGAQPPAKPDHDAGRNHDGGFNLEAYLAKHPFEILKRKPWNSHPGALIYEVKVCPLDSSHTDGVAAFTLADGVPGFSCHRNGCHGKTIKDVFRMFPPEPPALLVDNREVSVPPKPEEEFHKISERVTIYPPSAPGTEPPEEWPEPVPLQSELPPVEPFNEDLLPSSFRPLVCDVAERMQVPTDCPAVVMVLCLAGAVNRRVTIQPKANDTGWAVVPNLWGGIIAPPGFMKSPVIQAGTLPLTLIQSNWRHEYGAALKEYALAVEEWELRKSAWKQLSTQKYKKGHSPPERPLDVPPAPIFKRLVVNDATFEAMHQTMSQNPAGIFVIRDELTGWWSTLDRAGREGERAFCLQAWNGDTGHTIDRVGRGHIHVDACCMSMLGGIQPGRLRS
jgi:hypothetical protein